MRKVTGIMMTLIMVIVLACAGAGAESTPMAGGWQTAADPAVTEELQAVFDRGMEGLVGARYMPVAFLGSQLVAGNNYAFLCQATAVAPDAKPYWKIVYLYEDLSGNVSVMNIADFDIGALCIYGAGAEEKAEEGADEGRYESFTTADSEIYDLFVITKMNYGEDHQVVSVTGHYERVIQGEEYEQAEMAPDSEKTYVLAADFRADMPDSMVDSEMALVPVTDLYTWYIGAYLDADYDGHELVYSVDLQEEEQLMGISDFWFVTTRIVLNDQGEIQHMEYVYVPWA